jgi:hypothetical protein
VAEDRKRLGRSEARAPEMAHRERADRPVDRGWMKGPFARVHFSRLSDLYPKRATAGSERRICR